MNNNNYKMNELSLQEQKQVALDILSEIDEICKKIDLSILWRMEPYWVLYDTKGLFRGMMI